MYVVIRTDSDNVPHAYEHVYTEEYAACRVLDNAHLGCAYAMASSDHIVRESDTVLRMFDMNGRQIERFEVFQLVRDR